MKQGVTETKYKAARLTSDGREAASGTYNTLSDAMQTAQQYVRGIELAGQRGTVALYRVETTLLEEVPIQKVLRSPGGMFAATRHGDYWECRVGEGIHAYLVLDKDADSVRATLNAMEAAVKASKAQA